MDTRRASGWALFAGIVLFIVGSFDVILGLASLLNEAVVSHTGKGPLIAEFATWGWVTLLIGVVLMLAALGLFAAQTWARWTAIAFLTFNAVAQAALITAAPYWSIMIIAFDAMLIYHLTARHAVIED